MWQYVVKWLVCCLLCRHQSAKQTAHKQPNDKQCTVSRHAYLVSLYFQQLSTGAGGLGRIARDTFQTHGQLLHQKALLHLLFLNADGQWAVHCNTLSCPILVQTLAVVFGFTDWSPQAITTVAALRNVIVYASDPWFCQLRIVVFIYIFFVLPLENFGNKTL